MTENTLTKAASQEGGDPEPSQWPRQVRSVALVVTLVGFAVLLYAMTIVRLSG